MSGDAEWQGNSPLAEIITIGYATTFSAEGELHCYSSPLFVLFSPLSYSLTLPQLSINIKILYSNIRTLHGYSLGIQWYILWNNASKLSFTFDVAVMVPLFLAGLLLCVIKIMPDCWHIKKHNKFLDSIMIGSSWFLEEGPQLWSADLWFKISHLQME